MRSLPSEALMSPQGEDVRVVGADHDVVARAPGGVVDIAVEDVAVGRDLSSSDIDPQDVFAPGVADRPWSDVAVRLRRIVVLERPGPERTSEPGPPSTMPKVPWMVSPPSPRSTNVVAEDQEQSNENRGDIQRSSCCWRSPP
jgi:hypothetical protein